MTPERDRLKAVAFKNLAVGTGPVAEWLSLRSLLRRPRVSPVRILGADMALLIKPHAKAASHVAQPVLLCTGGLWGEEGKTNLNI